MGDSRLMNLTLACLTETQLLSIIFLGEVSSVYEIVRNGDLLDKFGSTFKQT